MTRVSLLSLLLLLGVLIGCDGGDEGGGGGRPQILETATRTVTAAQGGTITLPSGSSVSIQPGTFTTDQTVTLSLLSSLNNQPPSGIITGVGPALVLSFTSPQAPQQTRAQPFQSVDRVASSSSGDVQFVLNLGANGSISGIAGSAPIADVIDLTGGDNFVGIPGTFSSTDNTATFTVPPSVIPNAQSITVSSANLSSAITGAPAPRFGPRIWNGSQWLDFPQGFDRSKKTLVLTHGILSTVEGAFGGCVNDILAAGGYEQVVGFNYDWTQRIDDGGQKLASFLNNLKTMGLEQVDIEAHSFGTVVALAAASQSALKISNMVLEGGPLAGTPISSANLITFLAMTTGEHIAFSGTFQDALGSGMLIDVQPGSTVLERIRRDIIRTHPETSFIRVVGQESFPLMSRLFFENQPNDGLIPVSIASGSGLPGPTPLFFNLQHDELECDPNVIAAVGAKVNPSGTVEAQPPPPPPTGSLTGTWKGTWERPVSGLCDLERNSLTWTLTQTGNSVTGTYDHVVTAVDVNGLCPNPVGTRRTGQLVQGTMSGTTLTILTDGGIRFSGTFTATTISGTGGSSLGSGPFSLTKQQ